MRLLITAAALGIAMLAGIPAIGATTVSVDADRKVESAVLRADATTGRAWVEVTVAKRFANGKEARARGTAIAVDVPELSFDRATGVVSIDSGDRRFPCAVLDRDLKTTGECRIDARIEPLVVDTGFGAATRDRLVVSVVPR